MTPEQIEQTRTKLRERADLVRRNQRANIYKTALDALVRFERAEAYCEGQRHTSLPEYQRAAIELDRIIRETLGTEGA